MQLDTSSEFGQRVERRLREERVIWLTTVRPDGAPQPSPVWFLWDGETFLIYSQPNQQKLRNIEQNPKVALNFDGDGQGGDIIVFTGEARLDTQAPPAHQIAPYVEKYEAGFVRLGMSAERFAQTYSVPIRVSLSGLRGH